MNLTKHVILTVPVAAVFYGTTRSWIGVVGVLSSGAIIDIDHFLDFWHDCGFSLNIKKFFEYGNGGFQTTYYMPMHSYEVLVFFFMAVQMSFFPYFFKGMIAGLILHLFLDYFAMLYKRCGKWNSFILYSFLFRMFLGFRQDKIDPLCKMKA